MLFRVLLLFICVKGFCQDPSILYLTWKNDPSTTMTIMWHETTGIKSGEVSYKMLDEKTWEEADASYERLCRSSINVFQVELKNLKPDTEYLFRINEGKIHQFRTLPNDLTRPIRVAIGGDVFLIKDLFEKMNRTVASKNPDFVILGGDLAYAEGIRRALKTRYWKVERWEEFLRIWSEQMVTKEGRMIPLMPVIGNHDVMQGFDNPHKKEVMFYQLFAFERAGIPFRGMDIGSELSFILLDTGHTFPIAGAQAEWLKTALKSRKERTYKIPVYHIPAYPSESYFYGCASKDIRKFWVPLFEEYGVKISMEHDNHTFKRTFPLKNGKIDDEGIQFLGDGAWGVCPNKPKKRWYLAKASKTNNFWLLDIDREKLKARAFDNEGTLLDKVEIPGKMEAVAPKNL